jgi:hypothetical protein
VDNKATTTARRVQTGGGERRLSAAGTLVTGAAMTAPQKHSIAGGGRLRRNSLALGGHRPR